MSVTGTDSKVSRAGLMFPSNGTLLKKTLEERGSKRLNFILVTTSWQAVFYPISILSFLPNKTTICCPDTTRHSLASLAARSSHVTNEVSVEAGGGFMGKSGFLHIDSSLPFCHFPFSSYCLEHVTRRHSSMRKL